MGDEFNNITETRSSVLAQRVIALIDSDINSDIPHFYVDLSDRTTLKSDRNFKRVSPYSTMSNDEQKILWKEMLEGSDRTKNGVVRARINMQSDNGNLRDPVMLRYVINSDGESVIMPTYDLICPVLDSFDSIDHKFHDTSKDTILIALRDSNYYDRLEQYYWIQNTLNLNPTAIITFSRVNFENIILSKRKIKNLINSGIIDSWNDPCLMTIIDGAFNRGMTLLGLLHFYWLTGHISVGNRITFQDIDTLFSINNKILSQQHIFIMERLPIDFIETHNYDVIDNPDAYMILSVHECILKSSNLIEPNNTNNINNDVNIINIPKIIHTGDLFCKRDRLITYNLRYILDLSSVNNLTSNDLDKGSYLINTHNLSLNNFKRCCDIRIGETVKINNFKNISTDKNFNGYYYVMNTCAKNINGNDIITFNLISIK